MSSRCRFCASLTISHLLNFAQQEYSGRVFPSSAYYKHHQDFSDLEQSAEDGCDLCRFILDCFKGAPKGDEWYMWPTTWNHADNDLAGSMYAAVKELDVSDVKISIDSSHIFSTRGLGDVKVFDTLVIQVARSTDEPEDDDDEEERWENRFPELRLVFSVPKGMLSNGPPYQVQYNP